MSTGLDCSFYHVTDRDEWYYDLESWSERERYNYYGPFPSEQAAMNHLDRNHANPGGFSIGERTWDELGPAMQRNLEGATR